MTSDDEAAQLAEDAAALEKQGDLVAAEGLLKRATAQLPTHGGLWHNLGTVQMQLGDHGSAIASYTMAIDAGYASSANRGLALELVGDDVGAERDYRAALELESTDLFALVNLGTLLLSKGDLEQADQLLTRAAQLDPTVNWQLADVRVAQGRRSEALLALNGAIQAGETRAYLDRAHLRVDTAPNEKVEEDFMSAIEAGIPNARRDFSIFLDTHDQPDRALAVAIEGLELGDEGCSAPAAVVAESLGLTDDAIKYYRRAIDFGIVQYQDDLDALLAQQPHSP